METRLIGAWIAIIAVFIWLLAVLWHPFGTPKPLWHLMNAVVLAGGLILTFSKKQNG